MSTLHGSGVGGGLAVGPVLQMAGPLAEPDDTQHGGDAEAELATVTAAIDAVAAELEARGAAAGGEAEQVLKAAVLIAKDPALAAQIRSRVEGGQSGERAVFEAMAGYRDLLKGMGGYMAERATDLDDITQRVIAHLRGVPAPGIPDSDEPFILVARDLAPADTAALDYDKVLALVTSDGGPTSHTAILARSKGLTAVVGAAGALDIADGTVIIVDALHGTVDTAPDAAAIEAARSESEARRSALSESSGPGQLADGTAIALLANLGRPEEAEAAIAAGAEGVGLFRTEFLFIASDEAPSREEQAEAYTRLLAAFPGKKVVVRALDAGADKPLPYLTDASEENPALGVRGIRALRAKEHLLRDQLGALADAAAATEADLWVMAPMIADQEETEYFVDLAHSLGLHTAGVMAEVPSAAILADQIVAHADFVSIGTNDLAQYTLAADRLLGAVAKYQDPWHPAVLRLVKMLGDASSAAGKPLGVCGEAAADPALAVVLVGLGVTSLSMAAPAIGAVRASLAGVTLESARAKAAAALSASSPAEARSLAMGA